MSAIASKRGPNTPAGVSVERALAGAAGALTQAEGVDIVLDAPDAEVGRILKLKVRRMRELLAGQPAKGKAGHALTEPVALELPVEPDEVPGEATAREVFEQKALVARRALVQSRQLLSSAHLQEALTLTRQAVSAATRAGRLFTVDVDGQSYFPAFFVNGKVDRSVLEGISKLLGQLPGWTKWDFFTSRRGSLGDISALDALRKGKVAEVTRVAKAFAEEQTH
jgi:hypothetical protein